MAKFLRDIQVSNVTVTESVLRSIHDLLLARANSTNALIEKQDIDTKLKADQILILSYVVRFDNRGYRLQDPNDAMRYYQEASKVERVIFTLDSAQSERTNRLYGTHFEIRFDGNDPKNCFIQASSDDGDAVDSVFNGLLEIVKKARNKNSWLRNTWTQLLVQIFGVALGFILSLIAALEISPFLKFENSFVLAFIFSFLIFSNAWGFINQQILRLLNYTFPNIHFSRRGQDRVHWLVQTLVGGLLVAIFIFAFSKTMSWVGQILGAYVST